MIKGGDILNFRLQFIPNLREFLYWFSVQFTGQQIMKNTTAQVTRCDNNVSLKRFPENNINDQ